MAATLNSTCRQVNVTAKTNRRYWRTAAPRPGPFDLPSRLRSRLGACGPPGSRLTSRPLQLRAPDDRIHRGDKVFASATIISRDNGKQNGDDCDSRRLARALVTSSSKLLTLVNWHDGGAGPT